MKISDYIIQSISLLKRNPKYLFMLFVNISCLFVLILSLLISFSYQSSIKKFLVNNPLIRMVSVDFTDAAIDRGKEYTEEEKNKVLEEIKNIDHVTDLVHQNYTMSGGMINDDTFEALVLYPLLDGVSLPSSTYNEKLKKNEIIIPKKYFTKQYNWLDEEILNYDIIDGDSLVGKTITIHYDVWDCNKEETIDVINLDLKVVGTYDAVASGFLMYNAFTSVETTKYIADTYLVNITPAYETNDMYYVQVDNYKNLNYVRNKIKDMGYAVGEGPVSISREYYNTYVYTMYAISLASIFFCVALKYLFNKKMVNDNRKIIAVNMASGYSKFDIVILESIKNYIIDILSLIIVGIFIVLSINYYNNNMQNLIMHGYVAISPIPCFIFTILCLIIIEYIVNKKIITKLLKDNLSSLLVEE